MTKRPTLRIVTNSAQVTPLSGDRARSLLDQFDDVPAVVREAWGRLDPIGSRPHYYVLGADGEATPADVLTWGRAFETREDWMIGKDDTPRGHFSTVFLGLDHAFRGPPMLFETALFPQVGSVEVLMRYSTLAQAKAGHAAYVAWACGHGPDPEEIES